MSEFIFINNTVILSPPTPDCYNSQTFEGNSASALVQDVWKGKHSPSNWDSMSIPIYSFRWYLLRMAIIAYLEREQVPAFMDSSMGEP